MTTKAEAGVWTPKTEPVAALGAAVCTHWATARAVARKQFWLKPASWLNPTRHYLTRHHLTMGGKLIK